MDVKSLQAHFGRVMLGGDSEALADLIRPAGTLSPTQSLDVYRRNRRGALTRALHGIYPVCAQLLGDARFYGIAAGYARLHPGAEHDLNLYGGGFADFLQRYCDEHRGEDGLHRRACLPDLARLEWHYHFACYAADDPVFDFAAFAKIGESERGDIVFIASRALALVSSDYPLCAIWRARTAPDDPPRGREYLCVHRVGLRPVLTRLSPETYGLLDNIARGETLDSLSQRFERLDRRLPRLIKKGWVVSFALRRDHPGRCADAR